MILSELRCHAISQSQTNMHSNNCRSPLLVIMVADADYLHQCSIIESEEHRRGHKLLSKIINLSESFDLLEDSLLPEQWEQRLHQQKAKIPIIYNIIL